MINTLKNSVFNASGKHRIASGVLFFFVIFGIGLALEGPWWAGIFCLPLVILTLEKMYATADQEEG